MRYGCWTYFEVDGPYPSGDLKADGGSLKKYLPIFPEVRQEEGGRLYLGISDRLLEPYLDGKKETSIAFGKPLLVNSYSDYGNGREKMVLQVEEGLQIIPFYEPLNDFLLKGKLKIDGARGGFAFHLSEDSSGYFVEIIPDTDTVRLIKHLPHIRTDGHRWFEYKIIQENNLSHFNLNWETKIPFKLVVNKGEIMFSLNNILALHTVSMTRQQGKPGLFGESSKVELSEGCLLSLS
ncbi:hypothetical protein Hore_22430 [Halothermothrix orenii H 168]|uniref:3-keto-disaccharide hydrolase domain-containing protein n=1 Tax=Halothermothrix orenii (strain H 168 / OCM 544 / DSM 9562) TaxID=373903 RepID=B8D0Q2_HALOH|nr:hypothetical protein Hore_22430 [Halothermothrix orenii H 168]